MRDSRELEGSPERAALPLPGASWSAIESWCASIAGPRGAARPVDELAAIARLVQSDMAAASTDDLLAGIYFFWRRLRWNAEAEDAEDEGLIKSAVEELWRRDAVPTEPGAGPDH
jgi:hypothetical protein